LNCITHSSKLLLKQNLFSAIAVLHSINGTNVTQGGGSVGKEDETRFTLRISRELMKQVRHVAADRELSLNATLVELISEQLESLHDLLPI
jgi:hypothetical protein